MDVLNDFADELDADEWRVVEFDPAELVIEALPSGATFVLHAFDGSVQVHAVIALPPEGGWGDRAGALFEWVGRVNYHFLAAKVAVGRDDHVAVLCDIPADVAAPGFLGAMVDQVWWLCDRLGPLLDTVIATGEVPAAGVIEASLEPDNVPADRH